MAEQCHNQENPDHVGPCEDAEGFHARKFDRCVSFITAISGSTRHHSSTETFVSSCGGGGHGEGDPCLEGDCHHRTNLNFFHAAARFSELYAPGHFTKVRSLSDCAGQDGKIELHRWCRRRQNGCTSQDDLVVAKRVSATRVFDNAEKEACEHSVHLNGCARFAEDVLNEIGIYSYLSQQRDLPEYLLRMHTAFHAADEVWLVLEHADGGDLFAIVQSFAEGQTGSKSADDLERARLWTWQLLQAVDYLHKHHIGHRDISIENVLLRGGSVRLMDFGQSVQTHSSTGELLRYFSALGKPYYRPPECSIPRETQTETVLSTDSSAGEIVFGKTACGSHLCEMILSESGVSGQRCLAQPLGYAVPPVDVFACGVCLFLLTTGMPPWRETNLQDEHFAWVQKNGIKKLLRGWGISLPADVVDLLLGMMKFDPAKRPSSRECLDSICFKDLRDKPVPLHQAEMQTMKPHADNASDAEEDISKIEVAEPTASVAVNDGEFDYGMQHMPSIAEMEFMALTGFAGDPYMMAEATRCVPDPPTRESKVDIQVPSPLMYDPRGRRSSCPELAHFSRLSPCKPAGAPTRPRGNRSTSQRRLAKSVVHHKHRIVTQAATQDAARVARPPVERPSMPRRKLPSGSAVNAARLGKSLEKNFGKESMLSEDFLAEITAS